MNKRTAILLLALLTLNLWTLPVRADEASSAPPLGVGKTYTVEELPPDPSKGPDEPQELVLVTGMPRYDVSSPASEATPAEADAQTAAAATGEDASAAQADERSPLRRFLDDYIVHLCAAGAAVFFYLTRWRKTWYKNRR